MLKYKDGDVHHQNYHRILNQKMHCNEINQNARTTMHQLKTVTDTNCAMAFNQNSSSKTRTC